MPRSTPDDFKPKDNTVDKTFYSVINISFKNSRKQCKYYYKQINHNTIRLRDHLYKYTPYKNNRSSKESAEDSQQTLSNIIAAISQIKIDY